MKRRSGTNQRVLIISGDFVPVSSNCTFRALGFAEELPAFGWDPLVLTRSPQHSEWPHDSGLQIDCPISVVSGSAILWRILKKNSRIVPSWILADRKRSWIPFAVVVGVGMVLSYDIDVIFGSYQPWSALVAAYLISLLTRRPLICEFRDEIPSTFGDQTSTRRRLALARKIIGNSSGIVATTSEIASSIEVFAPGPVTERIVVLPHGYRRADITPFKIPPVTKGLILTFTGSFYLHRSIDTFCAAIGQFVGKFPGAAGRLTIRIVGKEKVGAFDRLWSSARANGIDSYVQILPWRSQDQLREIIDQSHLVWFSDAGRPEIVPGKLSKMFVCGRPVLAICSEGGATWRAVSETRTGCCFGYDDVDGIESFVSRIFEAAVGGEMNQERNEEKIREYSFQILASKLAKLFGETQDSFASSDRKVLEQEDSKSRSSGKVFPN